MFWRTTVICVVCCEDIYSWPVRPSVCPHNMYVPKFTKKKDNCMRVFCFKGVLQESKLPNFQPNRKETYEDKTEQNI